MKFDDDEIFCPNCNDNLREQFDFDESKNVNVCSNCGEVLLNPNCSDNYIWYCNKCNSIMNNQYSWNGETDDIYKCEECGAINDLSDPDSHDYWDSEEEYEEANCICPNCNANLKEQYDFFEWKNVNICSNCRKTLINPNCNDEHVWLCNKCESILNNQNSWNGETADIYKCEECGAINDLSDPDSHDYWGSEEEYEEANCICPNCNAKLIEQYDFDESKNVNICSNCGEALLNPNCSDNYIWYCNCCNSIMNNQYSWNGETDDIYECEECGAINDLSDHDSDDYWDSEEEYYNSKNDLNSDYQESDNENNAANDDISNDDSVEVDIDDSPYQSKTKKTKSKANDSNQLEDKFVIEIENNKKVKITKLNVSLLTIKVNKKNIINQIIDLLDYFDSLSISEKNILSKGTIQSIMNWNFILANNYSFEKCNDGVWRASKYFSGVTNGMMIEIINRNNFQNYNGNYDLNLTDVINYNYAESIILNYNMYLERLGIFSFSERKRIKEIMNNKLWLNSNYWKCRANIIYNQMAKDLYEELSYYQNEKSNTSFFAFKYRKECNDRIEEIEERINTLKSKLSSAYQIIESGNVPYNYLKKK